MKNASDSLDLEPQDPRAYPHSPRRDPRAARPLYIVETEEIDRDPKPKPGHDRSDES
jgi:hypothetical protein